MADIFHLGRTLTYEEARLLGMDLAKAMHKMISTNGFLYFSNLPATHITILRKKQDLKIKFIDWSHAVTLQGLDSYRRRNVIKEFIMDIAYLMRQELFITGADIYAWKGFVQTLIDPVQVNDEYAREEYKELIDDVERGLGLSETAGSVPTVLSISWQKFFESTRAVRMPTEFDVSMLRQLLEIDVDTPLAAVKQGLVFQLQQAGVQDLECVLAIIDDVIKNVGIEQYFGINEDELADITSAVLSAHGLTDQMVSCAVGQIIKDTRNSGSSLIVSILAKKIICNVLSCKAMNDAGIFLETREINDIAGEVFLRLQELELKKLSFAYNPGITGMNREWANHLSVYGPEPDRKVLAVYNIKMSHSSMPEKGVARSRLASELRLGPRFIYGDEQKGIIVEEWLGDNSLNNRAKDLTREERLLIGVGLGKKFYRMFDITRANRVTHKFDNLNVHIFVLGNGQNIEPFFIDWDIPLYVDIRNREAMAKDHLQALIAIIKDRLGPEAMAYFMYEIRGIASRISPQELDFYNLIYKFSCERMSAHPYLGGHNIMFFADTDRYLEAIEAEHLFEYNRENQMAGSLQASTSL